MLYNSVYVSYNAHQCVQLSLLCLCITLSLSRFCGLLFTGRKCSALENGYFVGIAHWRKVTLWRISHCVGLVQLSSFSSITFKIDRLS